MSAITAAVRRWWDRMMGAWELTRRVPSDAWLRVTPRNELAALDWCRTWLPPTSSKRMLEAGLRWAFRGVDGFTHAYKDCVCVDDVWYDLIFGYGRRDARWIELRELSARIRFHGKRQPPER